MWTTLLRSLAEVGRDPGRSVRQTYDPVDREFPEDEVNEADAVETDDPDLIPVFLNLVLNPRWVLVLTVMEVTEVVVEVACHK